MIPRPPRLVVWCVAALLWYAAYTPGAAQTAPSNITIALDAPEDVLSRVQSAAEESLDLYTEWLGAPPVTRIVLTERSLHVMGTASTETVLLDIPWLSDAEAMEVEAQVAYGLARVYWSDPPGAEPISLADSLAWYLQSHAIERLFNRRSYRTAYSLENVRLFGGFVPVAFPSLALSRWSAGLGRPEFLASESRPDAPLRRRLPPGVDSRTAQGALAFGTLERVLGFPVLQGALRALASASPSPALTREHVARTVSAAAGQDLSWFFDFAFDPAARVDYAVEQFSTVEAGAECSRERCYRTRVQVARHGTHAFTGTSRPAEGPYDSGSALRVAVTFADGQIADVRWDGRADTRTFEFESPAPAAAVDLDPEGLLLLDRTTLEHRARIDAHTNVPVRKWVALWLTWLQDTALTYAMLF